MRILITSLVDLKRVTHNRIHVFVDYLSRRHDVTTLCLNAWWLERGGAKEAGVAYHSDVYFQDMFERARILYLSDGRAPPVLQEFTALRSLDSLLREIDYDGFDVHVNYCNLVAGYFVARRAKRLGIPTVFDIADDLPHRMGNSPQVPRLLRHPARLVAEFMLSANVRIASKVTFVTQALKDAYKLPDGKATHLPNGVSPDILHRRPSQASSKRLGVEEDFILGFVGVLLPRVDLGLMFTTLKSVSAKVPSARMVIVGGGDRLAEARDLAAECGLSDRVVFTGFVPVGEVPEYISCMDVCLVPIADTADCQRAFPLKLVEYMACGKPVISTPLAGVKEAVGDRVLYASNSEELEDRILQLYQDEELRTRLGLNGRALVEQDYTWAQICARFEDVLMDAQHE